MNFLTADVEIKVDDSKLPQQLAKAKSAVTKTVDKIKSSFGKMATSFKAAFTKMVRVAKWGALIIAGAFALAVRSAMKQEDAIKRLEITLKATGNAAGFTAKQLLQQAAALQKVTRFGDETITAMQTMLLTFKNIKGDEFKRATEAALDMATAEAAVSGRAIDLTSTSIRLGKALNDPVIGMTALSRVGVQFTDTQKSMINQLTRTGNVAEAQRIILVELESQFGGMSRDVDTASGALKQMWNALGDVTEKIGGAFLPGITEAARAVKEWAERNEERIGHWAERTAAHLGYIKDVLWVFIKFLHSDWKTGIKAGLDISIELFKGFGKSIVVLMTSVASKAWRAFVKEFGEGLGKWFIEASKPKGTLGKILSVTPIGMAKRVGMIKAGVGLVKGAREVETGEGPGVGSQLKDIWKGVGASIGDIVPPELAAGFDEPLMKLKNNLNDVGVTVEELEQPMKKALIDIPKESTRVMEEAGAQLKQWAFDANNMWNNLSTIAISALEGLSDALTNLVMTGKADFNSLAESVIADLTRMIIKAQIAQVVGALFPGMPAPAGAMAGSIPGLQSGGEVMQTGIAKVHKGEKFLGVNGGGGQQKEGATLNINVSAIDAAGTFSFLNKNKRAIATMMQGRVKANHPLRRSM